MKVFKLTSDLKHYTMLASVEERHVSFSYSLDGSPLSASWEPFEVEPITGEFEGLDEVGDFAELYGIAPVFNERSVGLLGDLLGMSGELLPLRSADGVRYLYNVTRLIDALDMQRSAITWLRSGRILDVDSYEFLAAPLQGVSLFKLPQRSQGPVFATDLFVERLQHVDLTGFALQLLWEGA